MSTTEIPPALAPRRGRRPGPSETRPAILAAARGRFAVDGYASTTIRKIAIEAQVDPALVIKLFGSKEQLFAASMSIPATALEKMNRSFHGPVEDMGERLTVAFLGLWEDDPHEAEPLLAMFRAAVTHEGAATALREFVQDRLVFELGPRLASGYDSAFYGSVVSSLLLGVVVGRRVVRIEALAAADLQDLVAVIAPGIQVILDRITE